MSERMSVGTAESASQGRATTINEHTNTGTSTGRTGQIDTASEAGRVTAGQNTFEVVLVTYKSRPHVEALVASWPETLPIVVVDNARGADGLAEWSKDHPNVRYLDGGGVGFARAANTGAFSSSEPFVVFVNPDCRPTLDDLQRLVDGLAGDWLAAAHAATMTGKAGEVEIGVGGWEPTVPRALAYAVGLHKKWPKAGIYAKPASGEQLDVEWTTGACMAVRTAQFKRLGGFDEAFYVYSEDMSFGRRAREAGLREVLRSDVVVRHGAGSSGAPSSEMLRLRGASFANYVERYHAPVSATVMRGAMLGGYALRAGREYMRRNPDLTRQYVAYAKGIASGTATVGGEEVARSRFVQTSPEGEAAGDAQRPFLFVTKEFGIPPTSGGMLRTLAMVSWFAARGEVILVAPDGVRRVTRAESGELTVDLIHAGDDTSQEPAADGRFGALAAKAKGSVADVASLLTYRSIGAPRTCGSAVLDGTHKALDEYGPFRAAVVDHTCAFGVADVLPDGLPVMLSTHNIESDLMAQRAQAEKGAMKAAAELEARLLRRLERTVGSRYPMIVCTEHDAEQARRDGTPAVVVARNGVTPPEGSGREQLAAEGGVNADELLFTGALDWRPNVNGISWLLASQAWADLVRERPGLVLTVAGRNPSPEFVKLVESAPGARVMANVPSMRPLLEGARLGVAPLLEGGGSRIKLLEYVAHGLPSVSTRVGASGLDGLPDGVIRQTEEDAVAFCDAIRAELDEGPVVLPKESVSAMLDIYGWDTALSPIDELLESDFSVS